MEGNPVPSLCVGDPSPDGYASKTYKVCHPSPLDVPTTPSSFSLNDFREPGRVTVLANYYIGCNAGRRESGVFAHVGQRYYDKYPDRVVFITSLKGGSTCGQWANIYQRDAERMYKGIERPREMPLSVNDLNYEIRDDYFTTPFGHPSYVVLDGNLTVRAKFAGPCCPEEYGCPNDIALTLDGRLSGILDGILAETGGKEKDGAPEPTATQPEEAVPTAAPIKSTERPTPTEHPTRVVSDQCEVGEWSDWSPCSVECGDTPGVSFRWREVLDERTRIGVADENKLSPCPEPVDKRECLAPTLGVARNVFSACGPDLCVPELGLSYTVDAVQTDFDSPRDVAFHPAPGKHLLYYSEGRDFNPSAGEEAWVVNGNNHSVSIVASLGDRDHQTTISRRDRGYYHYMINATALSFNTVSGSGRDSDKDSFGYWAVCNDNNNDYLGSKEPNYFMGPTLYNSDPNGGNLVNRVGDECRPGEPCFFLHADMLHESPSCIGIAHDPETSTAFGNVYWAFDATGNRENGQLVRFDFQQPHGPGSMDHSVAAIRRYPEIKLQRGPPGVHAGVVVHPTRREVYIASPGAGMVIVVGADSGTFARTAREEYPIFSNRLPSFEYSIWECVDHKVFASGLSVPSGMALSHDGERLFVAEHFTGKIHIFEVSTGSRLSTIATGYESVGGMAIAPQSGVLHFVDSDTNSLVAVRASRQCSSPSGSRLSAGFTAAVEEAKERIDSEFSLMRNYACQANPIVPDVSFFDQVHVESGYADDDPNVQSSAGMDDTASLLANRTDCERDSPLNFDALLLGGYYCHQCLPHNQGAMCDFGGKCSNVQWRGYTCDNEFMLDTTTRTLKAVNGSSVDMTSLRLIRGVTYRITAVGNGVVSIHGESGGGIGSTISIPGNDCNCASKGPLLIPIDRYSPSVVLLKIENGEGVATISLSVLGDPDPLPSKSPTSLPDNDSSPFSPNNTSPAASSSSCWLGQVVFSLVWAWFNFL
eukprot:CAMPEP_0183300414 /NCGR_PEP_ID=MMETSP0160_2-20130417/6849_1 /TAXON_ID=2839 ORGANISM="Odontella Sinensis, Strain Grunow 1884" /NCGR_SAMPLE_ID=MMETSP0160_2 /ASSEMBLY_ACC=CAM_ASM_000250 /LENGTH=986 /DNA_ID=CAMNT_0025462829 /DNA_START=130 /DNA_END=3090 /DNA_ORIENTATION=-